MDGKFHDDFFLNPSLRFNFVFDVNFKLIHVFYLNSFRERVPHLKGVDKKNLPFLLLRYFSDFVLNWWTNYFHKIIL